MLRSIVSSSGLIAIINSYAHLPVLPAAAAACRQQTNFKYQPITTRQRKKYRNLLLAGCLT